MDEKKEKILLVARNLFGQYGLRSVTMDEIAVETGMSKKTIYQVFKDKKSLIKEVINYEIERMRNRILEAIKNKNLNPIERTIEIHKLIIQMQRNYPPQLERDLQRLYPDIIDEIQSRVMEQMRKAIIDNLKNGIAQGYFREDLNPEIIAGFQMVRSQFYRLRHQMPFLSDYSNEEIVKELLKYHLHGICSNKGLEFLQTINFDML